MTKLSTILLDNDIIEIFYNENLSKRPYLIRLINFNNERYEVRASQEDLEELSSIIDNIITNESKK